MRVVVSACRKVNLLAFLTIVAFIALYAAFKDLTSEGLKGTQIFLVLGYAIYPLFYGTCLFVLWKLTSLYRQADTFLSMDTSNLFIWGEDIPLKEISSVTVQPSALFSRLVIATKDGTETKISSAALARPICDVADQVKAAAHLV